MHEAHSKLDEGHGRHCRDERNEGVRTGNQKGKIQSIAFHER